MGELLKQVEPSKGGRPTKTDAGGGTGFSRKQAASDAGISHRQMHTALRVANVSRETTSTTAVGTTATFSRERC
jgi:hypothetical protein